MRAMHEESRQQTGQEESLTERANSLIEQQIKRIAEMQEQILELSSTNSTLMNELQKKSETIKSLNEQIGKLSESDKVLKNNEELKKLNSELLQEKKQAEAKAMTEVGNVKREYEQKENELLRLKAQANKAKIDAEAYRDNQKELVEQETKKLYNSRKKSLESAYQGKRLALDGVFFGSLAYGILCTVFTAVRSERFVSDFKAFFVAVWTFLRFALKNVLKLATWASQLGDMIPQQTVAFIFHWLILLAVILIIGCGVLFLLNVGFAKVCDICEGFADTLTLTVSLVSLATTVFFAEPIRSVLPVNLLLLLIITHVIYVLIRRYMTEWRYYR